MGIIATMILFTGCKKGDTGPAGAVGPAGPSGPSAKTYMFTGTFDASTTFIMYSGVTGFSQDDAVITYVFNATYGSTDYYVQMPYVVSGLVNCYAEVGQNGNIFVNTVKADGASGSPWTSSTTLKFKAVHIKSSQLKAHPNVNWANYSEVKKTFNLKD